MAYQVEEPNDDDAARVEKAVVNALGLAVARLADIGLPKGSDEAKFVEAMDLRVCVMRQMPAQVEVQRLKALAWKYRRQLPRSLAPKLPPHDPVVREMEASHE